MKFRKIATLASAGAVVAGVSALGLGVTPAFAAVETVTFEVDAGSLALAQTPTDDGTALVQGSAVAMPVTTVTDGRNAFDRSGSWTVTALASDLVAPGATIPAAEITINDTSGSFTTGTGTAGVLGLVSAAANSIGSVYTYTPTALLAAQTNAFAGSYVGTVTQTVT